MGLGQFLWGGSFYGNVRFTYDWAKLRKGRRLYWVEDIKAHNSYHILVTDKELKGRPADLYDPRKDRGPVRREASSWYFNGEHIAEFMIEADLSLDDCTEISFVAHHHTECVQYGRRCPDANVVDFVGGGRFLAHVFGHGREMAKYFVREVPQRAEGLHLRNAMSSLFQDLAESNLKGEVVDNKKGELIVKGALLLYADGLVEDARNLVTQLSSQAMLKAILQDFARKYLGVPKFILLA